MSVVAEEAAAAEAALEAADDGLRVMSARSGRARYRPRSRAQMEADRLQIAPLFAYLEAHCIPAMTPVRRAAMRRGARPMTRSQLHYLKAGRVRIPPTFIVDVCREIGQPVEVVMNWRPVTTSEVPPPVDAVGSDAPPLAADRAARRAS